MADNGDFSFSYDLTYSFKEEYSISDLEIKTVQSLVDKIYKKDITLLKKYLRNYYSVNRKVNSIYMRRTPLCEILDNIDDIFDCVGMIPEGKENILPMLLFRTLFGSKILTKAHKMINYEEL